MTRLADAFRPASLGAAALAIALGLAAPAQAATDYTRYPTAVAANAAEVMAQYGGVVIDVETLFPGENRALSFIGCGVQKRDPDRLLPPDEQDYNFTRCKPAFSADQILPPYQPPINTVPPPTDTIESPRIDNVYE